MMEHLCLLGVIIITILVFIVVVKLPYRLIRYMRLSFKLARELKKRTTQQKQAIQQLRNDQGEMKRQSLVCETLDAKMRFLNFKESLPLYSKECKIILFVFILFSLLQSACSIANWVWWKSDRIGFIMMLLSAIWVGTLLLSPIIGMVCIKLTRKLRETLQQLEEAIKQRDQAIRMQNVQERQNDE
ncbi:hypothetical protein [Bartonella tribocorum]|uniref:Uncharacterized protein n=1 Tax=Bartonella tribocorum TaxID=85701 RepID=A0A2M6USJ4_9HYPH|nr:hypothetical protein [Bartonella tribocorum]PIT69168.1 hypothetical protein CEV08_06745 [Bartonella tribocorum]